MFRRTLLVGVMVLTGATAATAQDVSVGNCAGVTGIQASPAYVGIGGAWVSPSGCLGPRDN
jgi:hypothetical protein